MIPVIDLATSWRFIQIHPVLTVAVLVALLSLSWAAHRLSRRYPRLMGQMRAVSLLLIVGAGVWFYWAYTTREPSLVEKLRAFGEQSTQQLQHMAAENEGVSQ